MPSKKMHHRLELGLIVVLALVIDMRLILAHCRARSSLLCPHPCPYFLVCSASPLEEINPCSSGLQQLSWFFPILPQENALAFLGRKGGHGRLSVVSGEIFQPLSTGNVGPSLSEVNVLSPGRASRDFKGRSTKFHQTVVEMLSVTEMAPLLLFI